MYKRNLLIIKQTLRNIKQQRVVSMKENTCYYRHHEILMGQKFKYLFLGINCGQKSWEKSKRRKLQTGKP
jgi:hypothetical protein